MTSCTGSSASSTWRTNGSSSDLASEIRRLDEPVAQRADHRLDLLDHVLTVELGQRTMDQVGPAVELEVEALRDLVGHGHLTPHVAFAAAELHPPRLRRDGLPFDGVDVVLAASGTVVEGILARTRG